MKLRTRKSKSNEIKVLQLPLPTLAPVESQLQSTVRDLVMLIAENYCLPIDAVRLSLNQGKSLIDCDPTTKLSALGIVSGDLITVISENQEASAEDVADTSSNHTNLGSASFVHKRNLDVPNLNCSNPAEHNHDPANTSAIPKEEQQVCLLGMEESEHKNCSDMNVTKINHCLKEPIFLRDSSKGSIPLNLEKLLELCAPTCPSDLLILCVHILMCESGFSSENFADSILSTGRTSASSWLHNYVLNSVAGVCKLMCVTVGNTLLIYGVVNGLHLEKLTLHTADYINAKETEASQQLKNLSRLSLIFKDKLASVAVLKLKEDAGMDCSGPLLCLPLEIMRNIMALCDAQSLCRLGQTCKYMSTIYTEPFLWRRLCLKHFGGGRVDNSLSQDWYTLYKQKAVHRAQINLRRRLWNETLHQRDFPPDPMFPGTLPRISPVPGVIGGSYDLYPGLENPFNIQPVPPSFPLNPMFASPPIMDLDSEIDSGLARHMFRRRRDPFVDKPRPHLPFFR